MDRKYELDQDIMDAAEILSVPTDTIETRMNEQMQEDIRRENLLQATNESTHTIDTLRKALNIQKLNILKLKN